MDTTDTDATAVDWRRLPASEVTEPVVETVPYLELKLEHPGLDPTAHSEQFFPNAIPYERDGVDRVFYWQPTLAADAPTPADWRLSVATTHGLTGVERLPARVPALTTEGATGTIVVVDGTVAGDARTATVGSYSVPTVRIEGASESGVELSACGTTYSVSSGERRRVELPQQRVAVRGTEFPETGATELTETATTESAETATTESAETATTESAGTTATESAETGTAESTETVTPVLAVRYPGRREIHHPAPGATHRLFPSFGLDLADLPNPLPVPTTARELDDGRLAERLGVDRSARPYAERVLWQAFAYTAFDPHADATPALAQLPRGHIVLRKEES